MKKTSMITLASLMVMLAGCATVPPPVQQMVDEEPTLVGKPVAEKIFETSQSINDQLELLERVEKGGHIGKYSIVEHNNKVDARKGSDRTLPRAYSKEEVASAVTKAVSSPAAKKVKRIEWSNNSLNELANNFAKALGYTLVVKESVYIDRNVNFLAENVTLKEALEKLRQQVAPSVEIIVVEQNKTINVIYKKQ